MQLYESFHSPKLGIYQYKKFTDPKNYKKHPYYEKIKDRMEDAISKGYTFGPVIHYGIDIDSKAGDGDYNDIINKNDKGLSGYAGIGNAPGGIFFSIAEGNDSDFYDDLTDNNTYKNNPFTARYFMYSMGVRHPHDAGGMVCMLKAQKYCNLGPYVNRGILDDDFQAYIIDSKYFHIVKRFLKKAFSKVRPKAVPTIIGNIYQYLDSYSIRNCGGFMPTFLSGSFDDLIPFINSLPKGYIKFLDEHFYTILKDKNVNKLQTFILDAYGYDPVIEVGGEIICYDMNSIYICGKTPDTERLKDIGQNEDIASIDKIYHNGY